MKIYKISQKESTDNTNQEIQTPKKNIIKLDSHILDKVIKSVSNKVNLFSGNCGVFAIALSKFLKTVGSYNLLYFIYVNQGELSFEDYLHAEDVDIYHIILSVEGDGIDDFFDGHGSCGDSDVSSILGEYSESFETVTLLKLPVDTSKVETFIRSNTNYDSGSINEYGILDALQKEYNRLINENL